jgi:hypothetical protein
MKYRERRQPRAVRALMTAMCLVTAGASASAQKPSADKSATKVNKTLTLVGCVEKGNTPNQFTLSDDESGKYVVTGARIGRYVGLRVEIAGVSDNPRFKVKGGLWPTANVAGQAGAIDPARAAVAAQPGGPASATGEVDLPKIVVKSVRALDARCR